MPIMRGRGQGTKLADGRWRVVVKRLVDGKEVKKSFSRKTLREAQEAAREWKPKHQPDLPLKVLLDEWLASCKLRVAPSTYRSYDLAARKIKEKIGFVRLSKLVPKHFEDAFREIAGTRLPSQVRVVMGTAMEYAKKNRYIDWNPAVLAAVPRTKRAPERPILTMPDLLKVVEATEEPRFRVLWLFLAQTGFRPGKEALAVRRCDLHEDDDGWWVEVSDSKTHSGRRSVPISYDLYQMVDSLGEHDLIWPGISLRFVHGKWKEAFAKARVPYTNPYQLRHLAATEMARRGVSRTALAKFLGHADPRITERYYITVSKEELRNALGE